MEIGAYKVVSSVQAITLNRIDSWNTLRALVSFREHNMDTVLKKEIFQKHISKKKMNALCSFYAQMKRCSPINWPNGISV